VTGVRGGRRRHGAGGPSDGEVRVGGVDREALDRARGRIAEARAGTPDRATLAAALEQARAALEDLAVRAAELEASVPERLGTAIETGIRTEVIPVARNLAEVRGLSGQTIRRLERLQADVTTERQARVEDLALLVDLVSSGWRAVERRLDRLERSFDRLEQSVEDRRPVAEVYRLEDRQDRRSG
jgi:hypothetical protein